MKPSMIVFVAALPLIITHASVEDASTPLYKLNAFTPHAPTLDLNEDAPIIHMMEELLLYWKTVYRKPCCDPPRMHEA